MTGDMGASAALRVGSIREDANPGSSLARDMDLHNNRIGTICAARKGGCESACMGALNGGEWREIVKGSLVPSRAAAPRSVPPLPWYYP